MFQHDARQGKLLNYIHLGGSLVAIADQPLGGGAITARRYQHTDALGTPVAVTDENRVVLERNEYEPFGELLNRPQHDGPSFTGHVQDALTGLTYMQQRYYDPMIGRFLSVDPVTALEKPGADFNRYAYVDNNPYKNIDPDGRRGAAVWLVKLTADGMRKVARISIEQAVRARRAGESIVSNRRQISHQIETAAHGSEDQLKHAGHELADGSKGLPHYQTDGVTGHSFWGTVASSAVAIAGALDKAADAADHVDPTSVMTHIGDAGRAGTECASGCTNEFSGQEERKIDDGGEENDTRTKEQK